MGLGSFAKTKRNTELQGETDREFTSERWMECFGDRGIQIERLQRLQKQREADERE